MGDRYDRGWGKGPRAPFVAGLRRPPPEIIRWGLGEVAAIGHNGGPPLDPPINDIFVAYRWRKAHREAWKNPPYSIMMFRLKRAEAAGVTYEEYTSELLDSGRHLQAGDRDKTPKA
jgi:hypothetical protein